METVVAAPHCQVPEGAAASASDRPQQHGITDQLARLFLKRLLPADTGFVMKSYKYRPIASLGEGYTTARKVLEVAYRNEKSGEEDVALLVVKIPSGNFIGMMREMGLYEREVVMYSQAIEHSRRLLSQRGKQAVLPFARYVFGRMVLNGEARDDQDQPIADQPTTEMLVIELLQDFQTIDKKAGLDVEHLRLVMPALARFHALGLVLRLRHPERANRIRQVRTHISHELERMASVRPPSCAILENLGMQAEADGLAQLCTVDCARAAYSSAFSGELKVVTLVHGDLWSGNMMFRYGTDADGARHPVDIRFVDLQMSQFGDPAFDLVYCLLSSSQRATRRDHIRQMINWYEESFRSQLLALGEDPGELAPWLNPDRLVEMYGQALAKYIFMAIDIAQVLFAPAEDRAEVTSSSGIEEFMQVCGNMTERWRAGRCGPALQQRILGMVEDLREFGHL